MALQPLMLRLACTLIVPMPISASYVLMAAVTPARTTRSDC